MDLAGTVKNAIESLRIWEDTHLADVHAELGRLAKREQAASDAAAEPDAVNVHGPDAVFAAAPDEEPAVVEAPRDAGGKFTAAEPAGKD